MEETQDAGQRGGGRRPRQARAVVTREAILEAVDLVVRESGVSALRIRTVAARAGVGPGSIYEYFRTREDLIAAWEQRTYQQCAARFLAFVVDHQSRRPGIEVAIRGAVELVFEMMVDHFGQYPDPADVVSRMRERIGAAGGVSKGLAVALRGASDAHRLRRIDLDLAMVVCCSAVTQTALLMPAYSASAEERKRWGRELGDMVARHLLADAVETPERESERAPGCEGVSAK
jgi:AcrR family transcriptional regulator